MSPEFRSRVFTPLILPVTVIGAILAFAFALSRVLLAVPEVTATITGISVAGYILLVAALVAARPRITPRALAVGLVLGFAGVLVAGAVAGAAGMRPVEKHGAEAAGEASATGGEAGGGATVVPPDALVFKTETALKFVQAPTTAKAGEMTIALENSAGLIHNVTFVGVNGDKPVVEASKATKIGKVTLSPGTVTYYCSIPGHRQAGMEGTITVQ
ncbi:MAG: plastocyanin/azurin family copper-binding protein [Egibacteraceae bacterium]